MVGSDRRLILPYSTRADFPFDSAFLTALFARFLVRMATEEVWRAVERLCPGAKPVSTGDTRLWLVIAAHSASAPGRVLTRTGRQAAARSEGRPTAVPSVGARARPRRARRPTRAPRLCVAPRSSCGHRHASPSHATSAGSSLFRSPW